MSLEVNKFRVRCHALGDIMTAESKSIDLSITTKRRLIKMAREFKYSRRTSQLVGKQVRKGLIAEDDSITNYSMYRNQYFEKNERRLTNKFFTGELDLFIGEDVEKAEESVDLKSSWSLDTFPAFFDKPDEDYIWQGQGYMDLSGAKKHTVAYVLSNTPGSIILEEKRKLRFKHNIIDIETEAFIEECKELERNSIFDMKYFLADENNKGYAFHIDLNEWKYDIPLNKRVLEFVIERDNDKIKRARLRTKLAFDWLKEKWEKI